MSPGDQRAYVLRKAQSGQLARDDPHWQDVTRRAGQGVREDQNAQYEVMRAGGAHAGSVNRVI